MSHAKHNWTEDQIDTVNGYYSKRSTNEFLDVAFLKDIGVNDPTLERLIKTYEKARDALNRHLRELGIRPSSL